MAAAAVLIKSATTTTISNSSSFIAGGASNKNPMTAAAMASNNVHQNQLTRSLERILEEAHVSGELKLSGRKLKDFPKAAGKYNLNDTVIAGEFFQLSLSVAAATIKSIAVRAWVMMTMKGGCDAAAAAACNPLHSPVAAILFYFQTHDYFWICFFFFFISDLSRNRFCELPEDVTTFPFLETLFMYHNTLRTIPDSVRGLHSLSYLDLR